MLDPEIKDYVINNLMQKVQITEYTQVDEITDYGIETSRDTVEGQVLLATGLIPNSEITQGMVKIGDHKEILVNSHMQTSKTISTLQGTLLEELPTHPYPGWKELLRREMPVESRRPWITVGFHNPYPCTMM